MEEKSSPLSAPTQPSTLQMASSLSEVTRKNGKRFVDFTVLQLNDVYEAGPVEGGKLGGLARVATLRRQLEKENPNLLVVMIGDFLAPSAIGATTGDSGQHMIEALNAMGLTHATVGNHEFDIPESDLLLRIEESRFKWVVSNVTNGKGEPFARTLKNEIIEFANPLGTKVRVALIGVCLDMVKKPWIRYQDPIQSAREQVEQLGSKVDVFLAMTHLTMDVDHRLGSEVPRLDVLMGGHEHEAATAIVGEDSTPIFKADSNARTVCVHRFRFDPKTRVTKLFTQLVPINGAIEDEPGTAAVIKKWEDITFATLQAQGTDPFAVVGATKEALNGYEAAVRNGPTNLTQLIVESFLREIPSADAVLFPSGQIRIDGVIPIGKITNFDIVRIFPLGGKLSLLSIPGSALKMFLNMGEGAKGTGGYQVRANITRDSQGGWLLKDSPISDDKTYKIVYGELPAAVLAYPPFKGSGISKLFDTRDVRGILSDYLRREHPAT